MNRSYVPRLDQQGQGVFGQGLMVHTVRHVVGKVPGSDGGDDGD